MQCSNRYVQPEQHLNIGNKGYPSQKEQQIKERKEFITYSSSSFSSSSSSAERNISSNIHITPQFSIPSLSNVQSSHLDKPRTNCSQQTTESFRQNNQYEGQIIESAVHPQLIFQNFIQLPVNSLPVAFMPSGMNSQIMISPQQQNPAGTPVQSYQRTVNEVTIPSQISNFYNNDFTTTSNIQYYTSSSLHFPQQEYINYNQIKKINAQTFSNHNNNNHKNNNSFCVSNKINFQTTLPELPSKQNSMIESCSQNQNGSDINGQETNFGDSVKYQQSSHKFMEQIPSINSNKNSIRQFKHYSKQFGIQSIIKQEDMKSQDITTNPNITSNTETIQKTNQSISLIQQSEEIAINQKRKFKHLNNHLSILNISCNEKRKEHKKQNTKIEETENKITKRVKLTLKEESTSSHDHYEPNQSNSNKLQTLNFKSNQEESENERQSINQFKDSQLCEISSEFSSSKEEICHPMQALRYCKITFIEDAELVNKNTLTCLKENKVIIISSVKPKKRIKKSKQDYYNDSNYTKNLLKGFRRYMKRFSNNQQQFQEFNKFFEVQQLNNELILKFFSHEEYQSYFNKFLSQSPLWWIQEAKIKDIEKQIGFFNLCKSKQFSSIKTKRKSFQRPQI